MLHTTLGKVILTGVLLLGGGGFLVYSSLDDAQYYEMVDKVAAHPEKYVDKDLKLHGFVLPGSIKDEGTQNGHMIRSFVLEKDGAKISVRYDGVKVDNLKDRAEVVAQGQLLRNGDALEFHASELMAKCPSKYQGASSNKDMF
jgi:cytochrome c-type biogenesis protein CcmE